MGKQSVSIFSDKKNLLINFKEAKKVEQNLLFILFYKSQKFAISLPGLQLF